MKTTIPTLESSVTDGQIFAIDNLFDTERNCSYERIHYYGYVEVDGREFMAQCETRDENYIARYGKKRIDAYSKKSN